MLKMFKTLPRRLRSGILGGIAGIILVLIFGTYIDHTTHKVHGVKSNLINLTLPAGSTGTAKNDGSEELWDTGLDENAAGDLLRSRLPINAPLDGLPYCGEETSGKLVPSGLRQTSWTWASPQRKVIVKTFFSRGSGIVIAIDKNDAPNGVHFQC